MSKTMLEMPDTKGVLSKLFYYLAGFYYDADKFPRLEVVYQFNLTEGSDRYNYYISIGSGKASYYEGNHSAPTVTIFASVSVWLDIAGGRLNAFWGLLAKKYRFEGSFYHLKQMSKVFGKRISPGNIPAIAVGVEDFEIKEKREWRKPSKVLVLNGSPRRENGLTFFYLNSLLRGIRNAGVEIDLVNIYDDKLKIEPCRGCFSCWKNKGECVIKDAATDILQKADNAYLTLYALPLYVESVPAKLKSFLDRNFILLQPYMMLYQGLTRHPRRERKEQYIALFSICGFPEMGHFKSLVEMFKGIERNAHKPLVATILRPGAEGLYSSPTGYNDLKQVLRALERAGQELIESGKIPKGLLRVISKEDSSPNEWRRAANLYWHDKNTH